MIKPGDRKRGNEIGSAGRVVAENIRRSRSLADMSLRDLSTRLDALGRPMSISAISKIENLERRVDVDDLAALAEALGVTPTTLIRPGSIMSIVGSMVAQGFVQGVEIMRPDAGHAAGAITQAFDGSVRYNSDDIARGISDKARRALDGVSIPHPLQRMRRATCSHVWVEPDGKGNLRCCDCNVVLYEGDQGVKR